MTLEHSKIVSIQIDLCGIHGDVSGKVLIVVVGTLDDVLAPGVFMVTVASLWTNHLTVTRVKLTGIRVQKKADLRCSASEEQLVVTNVEDEEVAEVHEGLGVN